MASSRSIGGIYAELSLKDIKFRKGLKAAGAKLKGFGTMAAKAGAAAGVTMAAGLAVGTKRTIALGAELDHLSSQTGIAVSSLMTIQQAYKDSGKSADSAGKDINKMQRAIYEAAEAPGSTLDYFQDLGMSAADLMSLSPEEQFFKIAKAIKGIENPTKQAALAMDIFGRSGGELLTVFKGSNLEDVNASLGKMPEIMEEFSVAMERADTLMGRLPNKSDQFFTGFTAGVIGQMLPALESVNDYDFTELGESLGETLASALEIITDGKVWEVFKLHAQKAFAEMVTNDEGSGIANSIFAGINTAIEATGTPIGGDFDIGRMYEKYRDAGKESNKEVIEDLERQINAVWDQAKEKTKAKRGAASGEMGDFVPVSPAHAIEFPDFEIIYKDKPKMEEPEKEAPWESSSYQVNSMQARGLGMGAMFADKEAKTQTSLLTEIKRILSEAETDGTLKWA